MMDGSHERTKLEGTRWKAVRLGLRLANSYIGIGAIAGFYALWCLIGLILCFVFIAFVVRGKVDAFEHALNPVGLYGFLLPMALMAGATWVVKLFSRFLWCGIPEPPTATFLALASVAGRISVLVALEYLWLSGRPVGKGLLLPETVASSGIAWLGLVAEWSFIRTIRHHFIPAAGPPISSDVVDNATEAEAEAERTTEKHEKSIFTRDVGEWFKSRFPRAHKFFVWILLPVASVTLSSLADNGNPQAIPEAIVRLAVMAPAFLQVFWIPGDKIDTLINAFSQKTAQENLRST